MKKMATLLFALILMLTGCNNDDDNASQIEGSWKLIQISGGISGNVQNFEPGTVVWDFDESNTSISVTNNTEAEMYYGLSTGTYQYELAPNDICNNSVNVLLDDYYLDLGCRDVDGDTLTLNNGYADGLIYTFVR
jgi:hypothetical protein